MLKQVVLVKVQEPQVQLKMPRVEVEDLEFSLQPKKKMADAYTMFGHALEMNLNKHIVDKYPPGMAHQEKIFGNHMLSLNHTFGNIAHILQNASQVMPKYADDLHKLSGLYVQMGHNIKHKKTAGMRQAFTQIGELSQKIANHHFEPKNKAHLK